jgi:hypothetical protein
LHAIFKGGAIADFNEAIKLDPKYTNEGVISGQTETT